MKNGFTLIELIVSMLLLSVLLIANTVSLLPAIEALNLVRDDVEAAQKAQFAIQRVARDFTTITNVTAGGATSITYDSLDAVGNGVRRTLSWAGTPGNPLVLGGNPLSDDVSVFGLRYFATPDAGGVNAWSANTRMIEVRLGSLDSGIIYTNRISLRNR
jgi:prepilin-type N-terminal cleavage/methylation domain-containing protein